MGREPSRGASATIPGLLASVCFIVAALAGCVVEVPAPAPDDGADRRWFEFWVTDAAGNVSRLDVGFAMILVNGRALTLEKPQIDLLAHRGLDAGTRVASGFISGGATDRVAVVFSHAVATIDGVPRPLPIPLPVLEIRQGLGLGPSAGKAMLVDLNVSRSLAEQDGALVFSPTADAVYLADRNAAEESDPALRPRFGTAVPLAPVQDLLESATPSLVAPPVSEAPAADALPSVSPTLAPVLGDAVEAVPVAGATPPAGLEGWFVQFVDGLSVDEMAATVEAHGGSPVIFFGSLPAAYVWTTGEGARALAASSGVTYVEPDRPVEWLLATSREAIRVPQLTNPVTGLRDPKGDPFDGRGVGVAVIDIGIDGTHPDLPHHTLSPANPLLLANYKVESIFQLDAADTDLTSGHGTHVTGILAGRGILDPTQAGVAPGARIYGFAVGEASTTLWTTQALDWVLQNHDRVSPPIRVVSNSWQTSSSYDPNALTSRIVRDLVSEGVVVVFAAGNSGTGSAGQATTSGECRNPTEGVVCVAASDDLDLGTRDGTIAGYSSRGQAGAPSTWPDVSAPGSRIRSASPLFGAVTGTSLNRYTVMDGTSMAAPHVSGVVALMLQANPDLTPARIEALLERTAHEFTDGGAYASHADPRYNGSHLAKGHGLLDARAVVQAALDG